MSPIPTRSQEKLIRRANDHVSQAKDEVWRVESRYLWEGIVPKFQWQAVKGSGLRVLPLPKKTGSQQRWMRALIRLARLALRNGRRRDLASMFLAFGGVSDESGHEEILRDGILHPDVLSVAVEWRLLLNTHRGKMGYLPDAGLIAFVETQVGLALYETVIRDALVFLEALANAAAGKRAPFWDRLLVPGRHGPGTPQFHTTVANALVAVGGVKVRDGWGRADAAALKQLLKQLGKIREWPSVSELKAIRDSMAHGKYQIDYLGRIFFDTYDHWLVNLFSSSPKGRRRYRTHAWKYRTISLQSAQDFTEFACSLAVAFWAAYEEFRVPIAMGSKMNATKPNPSTVASAKSRLLRIDPRTKRRLVAAGRTRWRELRDRVRVEVVSNRR